MSVIDLEPTSERALFGPLPGWSLQSVVAWILNEGRLIAQPTRLLEGLVNELRSAGAPVDRMIIGVGTLHPQIETWSVIWSAKLDRVEYWTGERGIFDSDSYIGSPVQAVRERGEIVRRRLDDIGADDASIYRDLVADGMTDYIAMPLPFSDGHRNFASIATRAPGGFTDEDILKLTTFPLWLGPIFEAIEQRNVAVTLLNTYVGSQTGHQILQGLIRRGDGDMIRAAIWYSDLRDFTMLNEQLAPSEVIAVLNSYFELVAAAVTARGGEILQFIGDAVLVIFRAPEDSDIRDACSAAVDSAIDALAGLAVLNSRRSRAGQPPIRFGVGLHVGAVTHGNVGSLDRLGFNVIGPAVNRTARLENLTKEVGVPLLMSPELARAVDRPTRSCGFFAMKGVAEPQEVFGLVDGPLDPRSVRTTSNAA
ncbi:MAG: adenylate/guanylate cyclase domain-containing protein [Proteobacteria bacterium]|nr:adenylate/guanylate cyclase domain-containing protein [Pseudomonadota bacterium]